MSDKIESPMPGRCAADMGHEWADGECSGRGCSSI